MCKKLKGLHNRIDPCMKNLLAHLSDAPQIRILASCCGHKKYDLTIVAEFSPTNFQQSKGCQPLIMELKSGVHIPRKKKFYKKDKQGYYFIPEVENAKKRDFKNGEKIR